MDSRTSLKARVKDGKTNPAFSYGCIFWIEYPGILETREDTRR